MDFGEQILLNNAERSALRFGDVVLPEAWPATQEGFRELELLIFDRIMDKRGLFDEMRRQNRLHHFSEEAFRLRRELGILYDAHDQLFAFALDRGYELPGPSA